MYQLYQICLLYFKLKQSSCFTLSGCFFPEIEIRVCLPEKTGRGDRVLLERAEQMNNIVKNTILVLKSSAV